MCISMVADGIGPTASERPSSLIVFHPAPAGRPVPFPELRPAMWAVVHGLAFPHLDGKLGASNPEVVSSQVHAAVAALLAASPRPEPAGLERTGGPVWGASSVKAFLRPFPLGKGGGAEWSPGS